MTDLIEGFLKSRGGESGLVSFILSSVDDASASILHGVHPVLPGDLGILFVLQVLLVTPKGVPSPFMYLGINCAETLFCGTSLFLNDLGGVSERQANNGKQIIENRSAFRRHTGPDGQEKGVKGAANGVQVLDSFILVPLSLRGDGQIAFGQMPDGFLQDIIGCK
jgi:hypothetical protein